MPYADNETRRAYHKAYYEKNKADGWNKHLKEETPEQKEARLAAMRAYSLKRQFGLTVEQYEAMVAAQDGKCAMCKKAPKSKAGRHAKTAALAVDHCHKTGKVRKLLCASCNLSLGWFERYRETVNEYLDSTQATGLQEN